MAGLRRAMAEHGYERATIADIARAAGLTSGLVHYHFASKQEVLLRLVGDLAERFRRRAEARLATAGPDARARLDALLDALLATGGDADPDAVACWSLVAAEAIRQEEVRQAYYRWLSELRAEIERLLRDVCRADGRRATDVAAMAAAVVALVEGYFTVAAAAPQVIPSGSAVRMARLVVHGLITSRPVRRK